MPSIGTCFRFYTQMRVEKTHKAFAYRIYSHFTQQCYLRKIDNTTQPNFSSIYSLSCYWGYLRICTRYPEKKAKAFLAIKMWCFHFVKELKSGLIPLAFPMISKEEKKGKNIWWFSKQSLDLDFTLLFLLENLFEIFFLFSCRLLNSNIFFQFEF